MKSAPAHSLPPSRRRPSFVSSRSLACIGLATLLLSGAARAEEAVAPADAMSHAAALSKAFRTAAERATPSVVVVRSETKARKPALGPKRGG